MSGQSFGFIPRGIEVLVKKAAVDPQFRAALLEHRAAAAEEISLELEPSEAMMLRAVPAAQLEAIIDRTRVPDEHRRAFLGEVAAAMLAALGVGATVAEAGFGIGAGGGIRVGGPPTSRGIQPDRPDPRPAPDLLDQPPPGRPLTVAERVFKILREVFPNAAKVQGADGAQSEQAQGPGDPPRTGPKKRPPRPPQQLPEPVPEDRPGHQPEQPQPPIPPNTRLVEDLGAKPQDRVTLRKRLEQEFQIKILYGSYGRLQTVGQLIDYVEKAVLRKEAASKRRTRPGQSLPPRPQPQPQPEPPKSFGIRPDGPPALGGIRPH